MSLLEVNDVPVIDYWLTFATKCKKLQPLENSVYVICNEDNFAEHIAWCETQEFNHMKTEHIFSNGRTSTDPRQSQAEDIKVEAAQIMKIRDNLVKMYSMMTGQTTETIINDLDRDNFLSAYEAQEYGLVDRVLEYNKETDTQL